MRIYSDLWRKLIAFENLKVIVPNKILFSSLKVHSNLCDTQTSVRCLLLRNKFTKNDLKVKIDNSLLNLLQKKKQNEMKHIKNCEASLFAYRIWNVWAWNFLRNQTRIGNRKTPRNFYVYCIHFNNMIRIVHKRLICRTKLWFW